MGSGIAEWRAADAASLLPAPGPDSHKYSRGVLGLRTGSSAYPGAAVLGAEAAWRTGIGLVRYVAPLEDSAPQFGLPSPASAILSTRPETVFSGDTAAERERCDAWLFGSGTDAATRSPAETQALLSLLAGEKPVVVDAGALDLASTVLPSAPVIITPHLGEFRTLWLTCGLGAMPPVPSDAAAILARKLGVTVLLKGSRTIATAPNGFALGHGPATPWLATAGTGDVLAGILAALVASHAKRVSEDPELLAKLGATAALLHDTAARIASGDAYARGEGKPVTALDVSDAVPNAIASLRG